MQGPTENHMSEVGSLCITIIIIIMIVVIIINIIIIVFAM